MILGDLIIIGGLVIFGFVGLLALMLEAIWRMLRFAARPFTRSERRASRHVHVPYTRPVRLCANPLCGYLNPDNARYCARCGHPLESSNVDNYG